MIKGNVFVQREGEKDHLYSCLVCSGTMKRERESTINTAKIHEKSDKKEIVMSSESKFVQGQVQSGTMNDK